MDPKTEAPEDKNIRAGLALKALIDKQLQLKGQPALTGVDVATVGLGGEDKNTRDKMEITLRGLPNQPGILKDAGIKVLSEVPDFQPHVQFESPEEHATLLKGKAEKFKGLGAPISDNDMKWRGYKGELVKDFNAIRKHGLRINEYQGVPQVSMDVNLTAEEAKDSKGFITKIEGNVKGRETDIKKALAEEHIIFKNITDEAEKTKIREKYAQLQTVYSDYNWNVGEEGKGGNINVDIRLLSPEQVKADTPDEKKKYGDMSEVDRKKEDERLKASNILNELTSEQQGRALGGSFLHAGNNANDIFYMIAGGVDMELHLKKLLKGFKEKASPEVQKEIETFLTDDTFKGLSGRHYYLDSDDEAKAKTRPIVSKAPGKPLTIELSLPSGTADGIIDKIAALAPATAVAPPPTVDTVVNNAINTDASTTPAATIASAAAATPDSGALAATVNAPEGSAAVAAAATEAPAQKSFTAQVQPNPVTEAAKQSALDPLAKLLAERSAGQAPAVRTVP